MTVSIEWQSKVQFYAKSASQKLTEISRDFGFNIEPSILCDHEDLASLRWKLQECLGKNNYYATRGLTKLYFSYLYYGRAFLRDDKLISQLFADVIAKFGTATSAVETQNSPLPRGRIVSMDAKTVNSLMSDYHFLGYGRDDGYHVGMYCENEGDRLSAAATLSPWDLVHATPILQQVGIKPTEVLVLSRLLSIPSTRRLTLSQFIAQLNDWARREMRQIKMVATYCNPNSGHYGTVYRGANFRPLCTETHASIPFLDNEYVSPRQCGALFSRYGAAEYKAILRPSAVRPLPLLIYYYPLRMSSTETRNMVVGHCTHPYPLDLQPCFAAA